MITCQLSTFIQTPAVAVVGPLLIFGRHFSWLGKDRIPRLMIPCPPDPLNLMSLIEANQFGIKLIFDFKKEKFFPARQFYLFQQQHKITTTKAPTTDKKENERKSGVQIINWDMTAKMRRRSKKGVAEWLQLGFLDVLIVTKPNILLSQSWYWLPLTDPEKSYS